MIPIPEMFGNHWLGIAADDASVWHPGLYKYQWNKSNCNNVIVPEVSNDTHCQCQQHQHDTFQPFCWKLCYDYWLKKKKLNDRNVYTVWMICFVLLNSFWFIIKFVYKMRPTSCLKIFSLSEIIRRKDQTSMTFLKRNGVGSLWKADDCQDPSVLSQLNTWECCGLDCWCWTDTPFR